MAKTIEAVYENGVFKPLEPVTLPEGQRVQVTLPFLPTPVSQEEAQALLQQTEQLFAGLSEKEIAEVEAIMLERCNSRSPSQGEQP
jgi:predicted DNA-binding antitoxin AbrB/MazE fold protein